MRAAAPLRRRRQPRPNGPLASPSIALAYFAAFILVATSTIWLPIAFALAMPGRWARWSNGIKTWTVAEGNVVFGVLIVGIGVLVSAQSILGLI